jgi:hypothetical protein
MKEKLRHLERKYNILLHQQNVLSTKVSDIKSKLKKRELLNKYCENQVKESRKGNDEANEAFCNVIQETRDLIYEIKVCSGCLLSRQCRVDVNFFPFLTEGV